MAQAFSFCFGGEDFEEESEDEFSVFEHSQDVDLRGSASEPELHTIEHLLSYLPSRISYSWVTIKTNDGRTITLPRRELFDIRAQIMAEDSSSEHEPIAGLSNDDITPHVYEGGFKTWECSVDLASYLANHLPGDEAANSRDGTNVVELGAGSALPSLLLFNSFLSQGPGGSTSPPPICLTLADYNLSVLTLSTIPNFLLTWAARQSLLASEPNGDLDVNSELCNRFLLDLSNRSVQITCISGAWGARFDSLVPKLSSSPRISARTVVLASETIYSPAAISSFVTTLLSLLQESSDDRLPAIGLVGAKKVYFGVGGGVDEFLGVLEMQGGAANVVWQNKEAGVGRVILEVKRTGPVP